MEVPDYVWEAISVGLLLIAVALLIKQKLRENISSWLAAKEFRIYLLPILLSVNHVLFFSGEPFWVFVFYLGIPCVVILDLLGKRHVLAVVLTVCWLWLPLEAGLLQKNYVNVLSATVYTLCIVNYRSKLDPHCSWNLTEKNASVIFWTFLVAAILSAAALGVGFFKISPTKCLQQYQFALPVIAILFLFAKAVPEELVYRGIFQNAFSGLIGKLGALVLSSALYSFTAINKPVWAFPNWHALATAAVIGFFCGWVYQRTQSLLASILFNWAVSFGLWMLVIPGGLL